MKKIILFALVLCLFSLHSEAKFDMNQSNSLLNTNEITIPEKNKYDANIIGRITDKETGKEVPFAHVIVTKTRIGAAANAAGYYVLTNLPEGTFTVKAQAVGYKSQEITVVFKKGETKKVDFELKPDYIYTETVVISANRNETNRRLAPTLVSVLDPKTFELTNSLSLAQGLGFEPGVRVENNCQNCGFSQVRINGLDGQYSQILIDSRPVFSALAGVYGLEQIPANMIERIELVRGGGSALFGSSAIGGTINVITKEPTHNGGSVSHTFATLGGEHNNAFENITSFNGTAVSEDYNTGITIFGQNRERDAYFRDLDEFSEIPTLTNRGLGFRSFHKPSTYSKISLEYHTMQENRRGGDNLDLPEHEALISESLRHSINGGGIKYDQFIADGKGHLSVFASAQKVTRNSYYGGGDVLTVLPEDATNEETGEYIDGIIESLAAYGLSKDVTFNAGAQYSHAIDNFLFMPAEITTGIEYNYQDLVDRTRLSAINDSVLANEQIVTNPSFFLQNEWKNDQWSFLIGGRADKNSTIDKIIISPRANVRYSPIEDISMRITYSEGFRAPQFFDEDLHTELAGSTPIRRLLDKDIKEERSRSISGSIDYYMNFGDRINANILVEGFYTTLKGRFTVIDEQNLDFMTLRYIGNADEKATVMGTNIEGRFALGNTVQLQLGATIQRSEYEDEIEVIGDTDGHAEDGKALMEKKFLRTPNFYSYFVLSYSPISNLTATFSGKHTGSMLVLHEQYEDEDAINNGLLGTVVDGVLIRGTKVNAIETTKSFVELNFRLAYDFSLTKYTTLQLSGGVQNITNSYQPDYDTGSGRASSYAYGPMLPRSIFVGAKISF